MPDETKKPSRRERALTKLATRQERRQQRIQARAERITARPPATAAPARATVNRFSLIGLGTDTTGRLITIDETTRLEHMHLIGATGSGKSTCMFNCIVQDIANGRGVCVLDPHGAHPNSLLNAVLANAMRYGWTKTGRVHVLSPNLREHVVGFDPLQKLANTDPAVIADTLLEAFQRVWDEDTHQKPTTRSLLRAIFMALSELDLPLADAKLLLDHKDRKGVRAHAIATLSNEYARDELRALHDISLEMRSAEAFRANIIGPVNRLNEFVSSEAIRLMFSMKRGAANDHKLVDLLEIMDKGHILLVDLQPGITAVSESNASLLGRVLLRYLFFLMKQRKNNNPFFVYVDECHRFMTDDVGEMLSEARKFRVGLSLAHQHLGQLNEPDDPIHKAVLSQPKVKCVFRLNDPKEAQTLAEHVIPLTLERPVVASIRPTVVGHTIERLKQSSYTIGDTEGQSTAETTSQALTEGVTAMEAFAHTTSRARSTAKALASSISEAISSGSGTSSASGHSDNLGLSYDPNNVPLIGPPLPLGMNVGSGDTTVLANIASKNFSQGTSSSRSDSVADMTGVTDSEIHGTSITRAATLGHAVSKGRSKAHSESATAGHSEALIPVYEQLPTQFHSKDNELYFAGEMLRGLETGQMVLRFHSNYSLVTVPPPRKRP